MAERSKAPVLKTGFFKNREFKSHLVLNFFYLIPMLFFYFFSKFYIFFIVLILISFFITYFFFDFYLFFLKPYFFFYTKLILEDFSFNDLKYNFIFYYETKILFSYNLYNNLSDFWISTPDFILIENNPPFLFLFYFILFIFVVLFVFFCFYFFYNLHILLNLIKWISLFLIYHHIIIPNKLIQLLNDYIEIESYFNIQFSVDYYLSLYILCFVVLLIGYESIVYLGKQNKFNFYLLLFFLLLLIFSFDYNNYLYFFLNIHWSSFLILFFIFFFISEFFLFFNKFIFFLEMTGIEPA